MKTDEPRTKGSMNPDEEESPELRFRIDASQAARFGRTAADVAADLEIGGQYESQQRTFRDLIIVLGFGFLAVLVVLVAQFHHLRHALLALATVPFALIGGLVALRATDVALNASSLMGCVLLVGLVVKNGILLLEQFEHSLAGGATVDEALLSAGGQRVRPILMTTIATLAGLAPLALSIGAGAELQRPMALAVIGGLVVSTAASLIVLPAMVRLSWRHNPGGRISLSGHPG